VTLAFESSHCPDCAIGQLARREFREQDPAYYVGGLLLPFALFVIAARVLVKTVTRD